MGNEKIRAEDLNTASFIVDAQKEIACATVGHGTIVNALSGGVDSSVVTMLAFKAVGERLKTVFVDTGLMRDQEPQQVVQFFRDMGISVTLIDARDKFFAALEGIIDPEEKRNAVSQTFYKDVFAEFVRRNNAKCILQGTILTDIEETVAGIKRQHNVFAQLGIDPEKEFGYRIVEPLRQLRKDGVRIVAKALDLPKSIYERMPFPGPGLATRIIGEVTPEEVKIVRQATTIVEKVLAGQKAYDYFFQSLAILHNDRVTGMQNSKRQFGRQIEIRCWDSIDGIEAEPTLVQWHILRTLSDRIVLEIPEVVSVTYNITPKPPSTIEAI